MTRHPNDSNQPTRLLSASGEKAYLALLEQPADPDDHQEAWLRLRRQHGWDGGLPAPPKMIIARRRKDRIRSNARRRAREVEHSARMAASTSCDPCDIVAEIEEAQLILGLAKRATGNAALTYAEKHFLDEMSYDVIAEVCETQVRRVREMVNLVEDVIRIIAAVVRDPIEADELNERLAPTPKRRVQAARRSLSRAELITELDGLISFASCANTPGTAILGEHKRDFDNGAMNNNGTRAEVLGNQSRASREQK